MDGVGLLRIATRRWWIVLLLALLGASFGLFIAERSPTVYSANAGFALIYRFDGAPGTTNPIETNPLSAGSTSYGGTSLLQDSLIARLNSTPEKRAIIQSRRDVDFSVTLRLNSQGQATSQVIYIQADSGSPAVAASTAQAVLDAASIDATQLQDSVRAPSFSRYSVFVTQQPETTSSSPSRVKFIAVATLIGVFVALLIAATLEARTRRPKSEPTNRPSPTPRSQADSTTDTMNVGQFRVSSEAPRR